MKLAKKIEICKWLQWTEKKKTIWIMYNSSQIKLSN